MKVSSYLYYCRFRRPAKRISILQKETRCAPGAYRQNAHVHAPPVATPAEFVELWKVMMVRCLCWRSQQSSVSRAARVDGWCQATQEQAWFLPTTDKCCPKSLIQHKIRFLQKLYLLQQSSTLDTCILWYCHIFFIYIGTKVIYLLILSM